MSLKSERLKKLEKELADLEHWLRLGLVPKKDIPKHIIEYASALAARFSDEKHSSLVTVVSAERKYVTKRKGMPPGKVHFVYEKDLMVKPEEI